MYGCYEMGQCLVSGCLPIPEIPDIPEKYRNFVKGPGCPQISRILDNISPKISSQVILLPPFTRAFRGRKRRAYPDLGRHVSAATTDYTHFGSNTISAISAAT